MKTINELRKNILDNLWEDYYKKVPFAPKVEKDLIDKGELWTEDHIAFRSLPGKNTGMHVMKRLFELIGYKKEDEYRFDDKSLDAFWMSPSDNTGHSKDASPKIFISELDLSGFDNSFSDVVTKYTSMVDKTPITELEKLFEAFNSGDSTKASRIVEIYVDYFTKDTPWPTPSYADYELLKAKSEYASWTLLFGPKINHFTVCVHLLKDFKDINKLGEHLEESLSIPMNKTGGLVKGNPDLRLEQISTMAVEQDFKFADKTEKVKYGFVEFAKRYTLENKEDNGNYASYYQGFVVANADKIFESTFDK